MIDPVLLFIMPGQLVLLDNVLAVFLHRSSGHKADLDMLPHLLTVNIVAGRRIFFHLPVGQIPVEICFRHLINCLAVRIDTIRHRRFRFCHPQKAQRVLIKYLPRLFGIHHVIRQSSDLCRIFRHRTQPAERSDLCHLKNLLQRRIYIQTHAKIKLVLIYIILLSSLLKRKRRRSKHQRCKKYFPAA